ncbi:hypothetical protein QE109_12600 [Fusibacter bizertensis]|uniref:Tetratricopeptide repeat protein n=1 Tax=Fusibacter bizertensis TaxID=1488331 RepID=A0ABT6NF34_9FIRM|nr:hypothetical protein [Fusibacter bizertensis]MDH8678992.1 hypothetical protein [Fusibacter bizertensis]
MTTKNNQEKNESNKLLFKKIKELIIDECFEESENLIRKAIMEFPHAPEPHNLYGILLEKTDEHSTAMKHFRIALELDTMYLPARHNLEYYGTFFSKGKCAYDESDCIDEEENVDNYKVSYDNRGIGHIIRRD